MGLGRESARSAVKNAHAVSEAGWRRDFVLK